MTFDERADRIAGAYRLTPRQARFVTLVALIGGYCLRRQYSHFAGIALGKNPAAFLDDLVSKGLATRARPRLHRSYVYHLKHRGMYAALGLADNRHRRPALIPRQARQIMLLDFALSVPEAIWYATEDDKVGLFTARGLSTAALPGRVYESTVPSSEATVRKFVSKWPIYRLPDQAAIHLAYLCLDTTGQGLDTFLVDHAPLIQSLPAWHLSLVYPSFMRAAQPAWQRTLTRAHLLTPPTLSRVDAVELHAYFRVQHALTQAASAALVTLDQAHERRRRRFAGSPYQALYEHWRAEGGPHLPVDAPPDFTGWRPAGKVSTHELPFSYDLFGSFPGIA